MRRREVRPAGDQRQLRLCSGRQKCQGFRLLFIRCTEYRDRIGYLAHPVHEYQAVRICQSNLLPREIPEVPGYEIMAYHRSSREVDGNYYDVIKYPDGKVGILVAAASGKGVPAAMVMTMARSFFRALVEGATSPAKMLMEANRLLSPDLRAGMYVEVLMVLIERVRVVPERDRRPLAIDQRFEHDRILDRRRMVRPAVPETDREVEPDEDLSRPIAHGSMMESGADQSVSRRPGLY